MAYVTDVVVITGDSAGIFPPAGFTKIDVDLNAGAGGKFIYLCYKKGDCESAITGLQVILGEDAATPPGYTKLPQDLNEGAFGDYIYLCYTKNKKLPPIKELKVIQARAPMWPQDPAFVKININLNKGARVLSQYIYLCYRYN